MSRTIMWFRRDLRLDANSALAVAAAEGEVVPLFVVDPAFESAGAPRRAFLADALQALHHSIGGAIIYRHGDPRDVVPRLAAEIGATSVVAAQDFGPYGSRRDRVVAERLASDGRALRHVGSPYAVAPGGVRKDDGTPYAVFTPFARRWRLQPMEPMPAIGDVDWFGAPDVACDGPPHRPDPRCDLPTASEDAAHELLDAFVGSGRLDRYRLDRDVPGIDGTSRLSAALRWGLLHPVQVLDRLAPDEPHAAFRNEICWREFYGDVLHTRPESAWKNLQRKMDTMPVDTDARARRRLADWSAGQTGYPLVDAGMRQLLATGWMHNRVRMIVASFLVKDLHLPWQWGARHFMNHLIDGDLASNSHGWQWAAGTGTDAAPYFRIFNPVTQSERFDGEGNFIRRWVPELAHVAVKDIHAPWMSKRGLPLGYPPPMVDHSEERAESLRRLALMDHLRS